MHDLIIIGANSSGISHALKAYDSGIKNIRLITQRSQTVYPELIEGLDIDVSYREKANLIKKIDNETFEVVTDKQKYLTRAVLIAPSNAITDFDFPEGTSQSERVTVNNYHNIEENQDVLIVGSDDYAVEAARYVIEHGANVVLAIQSINLKHLSFASNRMIELLEQQRKLTVLNQSAPKKFVLIDGYPMAVFNDRRTPDLEFDNVIYSSTRLNNKSYVVIDESAKDSEEIIFAGNLDESEIENKLENIFEDIKFKEYEINTSNFDEAKDILRNQHYNATITHFEPTHSDLWVLRVMPDNNDVNFSPGQYASLGLGYFENRIDEAKDKGIEDKWDKLVRRSYSISSRIFDENKYLVDDNSINELEFYIVLVPPTEGQVSVRNTKDLGYLEQHRELEKRYQNYTYIPLPTREKDIPKRYIQDLIRENILEDEYKINLDADSTHVFLCGNPSMIGLPKKDGDKLIFENEKTQGVIELLLERGFQLDERKSIGNVHVEEYW